MRMARVFLKLASRWTAAALLCSSACGKDDASLARASAPAAPALDAVRRLPAPTRRSEPRLSLTQKYRTCAADDGASSGTTGITTGDATGGCRLSGEVEPSPPGLAHVVAEASARARASVDVDALHALTLADLAWSDAAGSALDRAVSTLRVIARLNARSAPAFTDLAAALLVRADRRRDARDLFEAADVAARALEADTAFPSARFNLALALDRLGLVDEAGRAWAAFLVVEPRGSWADEARQHVTRLARVAAPPFDPRASNLAAVAAQAPQEARLYAWNESLGRWGTATLAGDSANAARELAWCRTVGAALEARGGDGSVADAVRVIDDVARDGPRTRALAEAHRGFAEAAAEYVATNYSEAGRKFAVAAASRGPMALWARTFLAATTMYAGRRGDAETMLRAVLAEADTARYPALAGRAGWVLGTTLMRAGRSEDAYKEARRAAGHFSRANEREYLGAVHAVATQAAFALGDTRATLEAAHDALTTLRPYRGSVWTHSGLFMAAVSAEREGLLRTALAVQDEGVAVASRTRRPAYPAEARLIRARLGARAGSAAHVSPAVDIAAARAELAKVQAGPTRAWVMADLRVAEATLLAQTDRARAIVALDSVVAYFERPIVPMRLIPALVARADARLGLGDTKEAEQDLDDALALLGADQEQTREMPLRASLVEATRAVTNRAVMVHAARGDAVQSLFRLERGTVGLTFTMPPGNRRIAEGRSRSHPIVASRGGDARSSRVRVAAGDAALVYALIGDTLLTWVIRDTSMRLTRNAVPRGELARTLERTHTALERRTADAGQTDLARLYDWLVRPVRAALSPNTRLVLVDNGDLGSVPWAALFDRERGRYLVEEHELLTAVSLAGMRTSVVPRARIAGAALLIGDPAIDEAAHPTLRRLAGAAAEVRDLAERYPKARVIAGRAATASALIAALPHATLVHYAGHALFDDAHPERSELVLAPSADTSVSGMDGLSAERVASLDLRGVRLVVLSACETVRSPDGRAGGFAGLAGAFAMAGAGGVLGATWRVDDQATRALMHAFHGAYAKSGDASGALRAAQLELVRSNDPALRSPAAWAGFRYLGG
ncbi:MAG: CHAT domain-containing protein [Gemmatimonadaceae bacterium]